MINKPFDEIDGRDLQLLIENAQVEKRTIEYKEKLPGNSDSERSEFLADVVSFASAEGGDIVFGIAEKRDAFGRSTGVPERIAGLEGINSEAEILRMESMCRDSIEPRVIPKTKTVSDLLEGPAIVMRIPKLWVGPYMVKYKGSSHFYSRNSAGKYRMDYSEIRAAFALSEAMPARLRQFREDRLARIMGDDVPHRLSSPHRVRASFLAHSGL